MPAMEIKVANETYNALLKRKEISLEIEHRGEGTPQRLDVRKRMASKLGTKIENVFVVDLRPSTGVGKTFCALQVYDEPSIASATVPEHIAIRNLPHEERAKVREAKSAKAAKTAETETKASAKTQTRPRR